MVEVLAPEDLVEDWSDLSTSDLGPGARLGRYELLLPIAYGGMARVWAARLHGQRGFQKLVAIKTILPHLARDPEFERMFLDEARIAAGVHHPNVCEIYELGEEGHCLYLVMEWVNGESLVHVLRPATGNTRPGSLVASRPIDARIAAKICADACAGLHAAHNLTDEDGRPLDVVHRDVSPHNILVSTDGNVKVADFGVAKALGQMHNATVAGQVKGKVAYMAPEQISGAAPSDRRSDVYSMGCVLYEATTGTQPFRGENDPQIMQAVLRGQYALPSRIVRGYPAELEAIIARALAPEPRLRFADAEKLRLALEEWLVRSGPLVTPSQLAAIVRERAGAEIDRRREFIKRASNESKEWPSAGTGNTPSGRGGSRSGVVPAAAGLPFAPRPGALPPVPQPGASLPPVPHYAPMHTGAEPSLGDTLLTEDTVAPGFGPAAPPPSPVVAGVALPPMRAPMPSATGPAHALAAPPVLSVQAARGNGGYVIAAIAGIAIAGVLAGGAVLAWRVMQTQKAAATVVATTRSAPPAVTTAPPPPAPAASTAAPPASATAAPAPAAEAIEFQVMPEDGYLVVDGVQQPPSLRLLPRPPHGQTHKVVVKAPGYKDEEVLIDDAAASPVLVILTAYPVIGTASAPPPAATSSPTTTTGIVLPPNPYRSQH